MTKYTRRTIKPLKGDATFQDVMNMAISTPLPKKKKKPNKSKPSVKPSD